jgi:hydrogenase maturation protein HypF
VEQFAQFILQGQIGAFKGLGGYHLVCDATSATTVENLRRRKFRDAKPFALMVSSLENARELCEVSVEEAKLLASPRKPIVLLRRRADTGPAIAEAVAPGNPYLGLMLPYTPLHHLLVDAVKGRALVMTSGNQSDEPIAYREEDATTRLKDIADSFLIHDRPIEVRCDDSVTRIVAGSEALVRRGRGYAPGPLRLPRECPAPILAVGGQLKGAFALGEKDVAVIGHHLGDLDHYEAYQAFEKDVALYEQLFQNEPGVIAHDLHPDYASTRYAKERARTGKVRCQAIQHHHAHIASCMAEHGLTGPIIGVAFDGTGYGTDGAIWGGEFLIADYTGFRRAAHLRYVPLPGGDQAIREPWRSTVAHLATAGLISFIPDWEIASASVRTVRRMIERDVNSPRTSSAGRLFDAVAALLGIRTEVSYEGQAAMELEWLAGGASADGYYPITIRHVETLDISEIDLASLFAAICRDLKRGTPRSVIARRFHTTVAMFIVATCEEIRQRSGLARVVLSGGCFLNALLTSETVEKLMERGFEVYRHQLVPTNDGGLCLGQLAIAAACLTAL